MFTSFGTALSALDAHTAAVDAVGSNLANVNTPGYKACTVVFRDMVTSLTAGQPGLGTTRPLTVRQFGQGPIQSTSGALDAAIQGDGFFVIRDRQGAMAFTRDGNFKVDASGYLLTASGDRVQGWIGTAAGNAVPGDIVAPMGSVQPPVATTKFSLDLNLNSAAPELPAGSTTPAARETRFSTPVQIFDSLGVPHVVTVTFTKTGANTWGYAVEIPAADLKTAPTAPLSTGTLTFGADGRLLPSQAAPAAIAIQGLATGAADMRVAFELGEITQFGRASAISGSSQNGAAAASLTRVALEDGGALVAEYSNGTKVPVAQLALASIRNPESLEPGGNNAFHVGARTAVPAVGLPDSGGRGSVVAGAIESSTVDIAREFTNLIVYQRGYQANSRVVTVTDELTQETINLKR